MGPEVPTQFDLRERRPQDRAQNVREPKAPWPRATHDRCSEVLLDSMLQDRVWNVQEPMAPRPMATRAPCSEALLDSMLQDRVWNVQEPMAPWPMATRAPYSEALLDSGIPAARRAMPPLLLSRRLGVGSFCARMM